MQCVIYKGSRKQDTYLYLADRDNFSCMPENLLKLIGQPVHVMDLDLHPERRLAQADTAEVLQNLQERGWHLQMPRQEEWLTTGAWH
ncbi:MAG: uncharacterized protein QG599_1619 [Pseudomonadota bacterium]|nr:uncharacterized protein [Pseudomonadota bacterium]